MTVSSFSFVIYYLGECDDFIYRKNNNNNQSNLKSFQKVLLIRGEFTH